ncbi:hypothetical protein PDL04_26740 [Bacillus cereus group sp. BY142LC]|nr:hypothetical protein [Bacillus cereus group sp. BY142LC]MDA1835049.1 hypothetical protein [Bacillus cereus group sp. BY142LC]
MEFKSRKTETEKELSFKVSDRVLMAIISAIASGIGTLAYKLFM